MISPSTIKSSTLCIIKCEKMRILLQFPEGLKKHAMEIAEKYEKEGHEVFLAAAACYGACDLALVEAAAVRADKIIHFGHAPYFKGKLPIKVEYEEWPIAFESKKLVAVAKALKEYKKVVVATTVQHIKQLGEIKRFLERYGLKVLIGKGGTAYYAGQVLGCDVLAVKSVEKEANAVLFIGDGMFHAIAIDVKKPVFVFNPYSGRFKQINDEIEKYRKRRMGSVMKAIEAKTFGIVVSTKVGQFSLMLAEKLKKDIEKMGRKAAIVISNEIEPLSLANFLSFDCYVNTACPRLVDDVERFGKPILNPDMLKEVLLVIGELEGRKGEK